MAVRTLVDELLDQQQSLQTPVARFAEVYDRKSDLADHYRSLIPLTRPGTDEQYAFEISLDRCTGCKACVSACHSLNGLDDHESWRDTGTIISNGTNPGWQQTITTACHHCEDPGCMNGCPVGAYEKHADSGIVRHLDDQCIGCSYCILKCPYDVPKYSKSRGIVRKCDMCHQRLADGEAPACVQACPTEAIRIVTVPKHGEQRHMFAIDRLPAIANDSITRPTTRYVGRKLPKTAHAADLHSVIPQPAHWPLVLMLSLTQAGIGILCGGVAAPASAPVLQWFGTATFFAGMTAAVFHLGQPLKAWRFFLGLRTSWLSREILAFSLFAPVPLVLCISPLLPHFPLKPQLSLLVNYSLPPLGLLAIFTSVMIYHDTHRSFWRIDRGGIRFFSTALLFGTLAASITMPAASGTLNTLFSCTLILKLLWELSVLRHRHNTEWTPDTHSARLLSSSLRATLGVRCVMGALAACAVWISPWACLPWLFIGELAERLLFFKAVHAPKMPGNFGPAGATH